jgi:acyl-CoA synthetase (AMP-forming)/AMP-acid ligase II
VTEPVFAFVDQYVADHAAERPNEEALVVGTSRISYAALHEHVNRLARAMIAAGVRKGDRIACLCTPHPDHLITFLAAISVGAIWVGLNARYKVDELLHVVTDADPTLLFARAEIDGRSYRDELLRLAGATTSRIVLLGEADGTGGGMWLDSFLGLATAVDTTQLAQRRAERAPRDACTLVYTSGSTGKPKGAILHHDGITQFARSQNQLWPVSPMRWLNYFPINHVGSLIDVSCPALVAGGTVVFLEQFDPAASLQLMQDERITVWGSVPSVFRLQLALPDFATYDLSSVQLVIWEGAAMPADMVARLHAICPRLATSYGMTEATSGITATEPTGDLDLLTHSVGRPYQHVEVRLVAPDGSNATPGNEGEILTRSLANMLGYWQRPLETASTLLDDGWMKTGDLAVQRPDGAYRIVGRIKEMFKSGGYNVYPREIESVLESHPSVAMAAVVGVPDELWQEVGIAYVLPTEPVSTEQLEEYCRARLANYKIPKKFLITRSLPLLPIGKIDKVALRRRSLDAV